MKTKIKGKTSNIKRKKKEREREIKIKERAIYSENINKLFFASDRIFFLEIELFAKVFCFNN